MKQTIAYLGGPMRGLPFWNFPAFEEAAAALRQPGPHWQTPFIIHSPAEHDLSLGLEPQEDGTVSFPVATCLDWDFQKIAESDCVIVLPGWGTSTGCHWEFTVAHALGKLVFQYPELTPVELPEVVTAPVSVSERHQFGSPRRFIPYGEAFGADPEVAARVRGVDGPGAYIREHAGGARVKRPDAFDKALIWDDIAGGKLGEVRVVDPTTGGVKGSKGIPWSLLPWGVLRELAKHYQRGCQKYSARNWEAGYKWSLSHDSLLNHLTAFWGGDDIDHDPTVGDFPHVIAVVWHACALAYFWLKGKGTDDRPA